LKGGERGLTKLLDFQASISDVKQVNPLFSTCKVRVLYTGKNRNMSIITKDSVEKALPTLKNIPIVGEYSEENKDYKGHGGKIDLDSYKYIHTTKPYGVVPESATWSWEDVKARDGSTREYLVIEGCYLWTGRYEEAFDVVQNGKGQSMEIEVTDGRWLEEEEAYQIDNFTFSALCILGDDVEPAFEDANITAYSLDKESFKQEFSTMLSELKDSLSSEKEENGMLKELLKKYSLTVEDLTAKGIDFNEITEDELEAKIIEVFEINTDDSQDNQDEVDEDSANEGQNDEGQNDDNNNDDDDSEGDNDEGDSDDEGEGDNQTNTSDLEARIADLESELEVANNSLKDKDDSINELTKEVEKLREFKLDVEKSEHENKVQEMFSNFQLTDEDVKDLDIHEFSLDEIEEKCYAILGKKLAKKKNFSKSKDEGIRLPINESDSTKDDEAPYGGLIEKYKDK